MAHLMGGSRLGGGRQRGGRVVTEEMDKDSGP